LEVFVECKGDKETRQKYLEK